MNQIEETTDTKIDQIADKVYPLPENGLRSDLEYQVESRSKLVDDLDELMGIAVKECLSAILKHIDQYPQSVPKSELKSLIEEHLSQ